MSLRHRLSWRAAEPFGPDPKLLIEVEGIDDVYRLARVLEAAQVEFSRHGRAALRGLDRKRPGIVRALIARMGPSWGYRGRRPRDEAEP